MLKGVNLTVLIGPMIPRRAPKMLIDALSSITVTNGKDSSGFQLVFSTAKNSPIVNSMLVNGFFEPIVTRVIIFVIFNGQVNVLIDGLITTHEYQPSNQAGGSILTITGEDLSVAMDLVTNVIPYPAMPEVAMIYTRLAPYAVLGIKPLVFPPIITVTKSPTEKWYVQKGTDRAFIKALAEKNGYLFFIQPGPTPGESIAYFGPETNVPMPQQALSINLDAHSNTKSMSFSLDGTKKEIRIMVIMDPGTKTIPIPIPLPNISPSKPPLGLRPTPIHKLSLEEGAEHLDTTEAIQKGVAHMLKDASSVTAKGSLDIIRYKSILRSRMLVGVRGAGTAYNGLYYVDTVTHKISKGSYTQEFTLSRDGLVSTISTVKV